MTLFVGWLYHKSMCSPTTPNHPCVGVFQGRSALRRKDIVGIICANYFQLKHQRKRKRAVLIAALTSMPCPAVNGNKRTCLI